MSLKKTATLEAPHATFQSRDGTWTWKVLKVYQVPKKELENNYSRWFCAVTSPYATDDMGDTYIHDIAGALRRSSGPHELRPQATDEWKAAYDGDFKNA